ncbi:hypothetical protein PINS_up003331 [Pythium insidiosum]|nr:hypothetical protein PINS_up003331 [Pythium insidiosum]
MAKASSTMAQFVPSTRNERHLQGASDSVFSFILGRAQEATRTERELEALNARGRKREHKSCGGQANVGTRADGEGGDDAVREDNRRLVGSARSNSVRHESTVAYSFSNLPN